MENNFEKCLEVILKHEGGYVNHPKDPGGHTKYGITLKTAIAAGLDVDGDGDVDADDVREFTHDDVAPVYKEKYWDRMKCDDIPTGLDLCLFDFGVNAGTGRSAKFLQNIIGTVADGDIGPKTLNKLNDHLAYCSIKDVIREFQEDRQNYYESLSTFETFGKGWTRRVDETTELALEMI